MNRSIALAIAIAAASLVPVQAQNTTASGEFTLQGRLSTAAGNAIANGQHNLTIRVYQAGSSTPIHTETDVVTTFDGVFSTMVGDNGSGGELRFDATSRYELGITVNNEAELSPRLRIGEAPRATTAEVALDAKTVAGFGVSTDGSAQPNTIVTLDGQGQINASLLANSAVTGINGLRGDIDIQGGGDLAVNRSGNTISLSFTGSGAGLSLPFSDTTSLGAGQAALSLTATGAGSAATFINTAAGTALSVQGSTGAAITATTNATASAAIEARSTAGAAINATGAAAADAVVRIQNTSSGAGARLISALDASGNAAFSVAANGQTTIRSTVGNALDVSTSAAGQAALRVTGGLSLNGPVGTATIAMGEGTTVVSNAYARANSVILLTVNNAVDAVPLRVVSQGDGSFTVGLTSALIGQLTGAVSFSYLIINQ
jgi:hypothetical protein